MDDIIPFMASERFTNSFIAAGGLLDAGIGVILFNYARIDIGRGDVDNTLKETFGVILSVVIAAVIARTLGGHSEFQGRNNPSITTK